MAATVTAIGGLIGLVVSLVFLARQTKAVSDQTKISNDIAGATVLDNAMSNLREVYQTMLAYPGMRSYFYDNRPCPSRGLERERVLIIAEMFADVLESSLLATRRVHASESYEDWMSYCRFILAHSPTTRSMVASHPMWWPNLARL